MTTTDNYYHMRLREQREEIARLKEELETEQSRKVKQ